MTNKTRSKSSSDEVTEYAKSVVSGETIAGPDIRNSCKRHLNDLKSAHERGLYWDVEKANKALRFFRGVLKLNGGDFEGQPFNPLPWQCFIIGSLFGWMGDDGYRRFREAYIETGKGSGKSPLSAGIGLYGLIADNEPRAEIYAAATKKDQAMILFRDAVAMVDQSTELSKRIRKSGTGQNVWNLAYLQQGSFFRPISSDDGQSGPRPHIGLIDEFHEHKTSDVVEMLRAGSKNRRQALFFIITNSGTNKNSPCWQYHEYGSKVAAELLENDSFFSFICSLDEGDDPFEDEQCWYKVNPSLQHNNLPGLKYLREQVQTARGMPAKESIVRRLNFCEWTGAENPWISIELWKDAAKSYVLEEFRWRKAYGGLDLSSTTDLTSLQFLIEPLENEEWKLLSFFWLPEGGLDEKEKKDMVPYFTWKQSGHLKTTNGNAISKLEVVQFLSSLSEILDIQSVGYDRWRIEDLIAMASDNGVTLPKMVPFGQGYKEMSPAIEEFETMLLNGELSHSNNPVMNWNMGNAITVQDDAGNRKLSKEKATGRIDGAVAVVMAVGGVMNREIPPDIDNYLENIIIA